jgi:L-fuculose-phosphate aldolase
MDITSLHDDCAFLGDWPGLPIADYDGVVISEAIGKMKSIILAHHGYLSARETIEEVTYLSVYLERAARMQVRARAFGPLTPVDHALAKEAHDYLLQPAIVKATFDCWRRQTRGAALPLAAA